MALFIRPLTSTARKFAIIVNEGGRSQNAICVGAVNNTISTWPNGVHGKGAHDFPYRRFNFVCVLHDEQIRWFIKEPNDLVAAPAKIPGVERAGDSGAFEQECRAYFDAVNAHATSVQVGPFSGPILWNKRLSQYLGKCGFHRRFGYTAHDRP
jgi:hypothetical protein